MFSILGKYHLTSGPVSLTQYKLVYVFYLGNSSEFLVHLFHDWCFMMFQLVNVRVRSEIDARFKHSKVEFSFGRQKIMLRGVHGLKKK